LIGKFAMTEIEDVAEPTHYVKVVEVGEIMAKNSILSLTKQTPTYQSLEVSSLRKKGRMWNPSLIQHAHIYATRPF